MSVLYGADAVYLAGTDFGMRSFAGNFTPEEMPKAVEFAHSHGVKVHVTVNTMPRNEEIAQLPAYLERLQEGGPRVSPGVLGPQQSTLPDCGRGRTLFQ